MLTNRKDGGIVEKKKPDMSAAHEEFKEQHVGAEVKQISNLIHRRLLSKQSSEEDTVAGSGGWILGYLDRHSDCDVFQRDLEEKFCMRRATVSKMIQLMEQKGWIERRSVAHDARLKKLILTEKGRARNRELIAEFDQLEEEMTADIPQEKLDTFFEVCRMLRKKLYELEEREE